MQNSVLSIQKQRELLRLEYEAEKAEYRIQTEKMGIGRKVRRGLCWYPVTAGRSYYNSLNQLVVEIENTSPTDISHCFEHGKPLCFFTVGNGNEIKYFNHQSVVSYVDGNRMVATIGGNQALIDIQNAEPLGVQLFFDETSYRTMFHALDDVINAKKNRLAELRDIVSGQLKPSKLSFNPISLPWLNPTQEAAVNEVLRAKDVAVVHGPPGTGKTTTLVEAIYETLRRETQVLVCAQSNMAVDWISEKLVDHGVPVLRIGNPTRVNDKMLSFTYERKFEGHPDYPELWSIRNTIRQMRENRKKGENIHQKITRLKERADELEIRINEQLFAEARVVACTLVGSASKLLVRHRFHTLFIDEAAQALEAACWIALRRANRIVLAGDHQQLPPTIKCHEAMLGGLAETMMERIVRNQPESVTMLKIQYRMNEEIMRFSSNWFYKGEVESDPSVRNRGILDFDLPISWIDTSADEVREKFSDIADLANEPDSDNHGSDPFGEQFVSESHGRINKPEARITIAMLRQYIDKIGRNRFIDERLDVGIISPYRVQAQYIRQLIRKDDYLRPLGKSCISVDTVDGFQGQERDIMLISLVRSNEHGQIGFLSDLRRMNVAMTRARMKLIIIGNAQTLCAHPFYRSLKEYIDGKTPNGISRHPQNEA